MEYDDPLWDQLKESFHHLRSVRGLFIIEAISHKTRDYMEIETYDRECQGYRQRDKIYIDGKQHAEPSIHYWCRDPLLMNEKIKQTCFVCVRVFFFCFFFFHIHAISQKLDKKKYIFKKKSHVFSCLLPAKNEIKTSKRQHQQNHTKKKYKKKFEKKNEKTKKNKKMV